MPRLKPKEVVEHRITMGTWEREQLKELKTAKQIKDVGVGVGIAAVGVGGTYVAYKIGKALYDWGEDAWDWVKKQGEDVANAWESTTDPSSYNVIDIFMGNRPLPETPPEGEDVRARDDGWLIGGTPTMFQIAWENTFS